MRRVRRNEQKLPEMAGNVQKKFSSTVWERDAGSLGLCVPAAQKFPIWRELPLCGEASWQGIPFFPAAARRVSEFL